MPLGEILAELLAGLSPATSSPPITPPEEAPPVLQLTGRWIPSPPEAYAAAARAWFAAARQNAPAGDRLPLWLRTAPDGKHLLAALEVLDSAPRHTMTRSDCECCFARAWFRARGEVVPADLAAWILAHKDGKRIRAAVIAFRCEADRAEA